MPGCCEPSLLVLYFSSNLVLCVSGLDNVKEFLYDEWQLSPDNTEWVEPQQDDDLGDDDDEEFDPEAAHDRMVAIMEQFRAH